MVYRDSAEPKKIQSKMLVVGDIFQFSEGMMIPADSVIIEVQGNIQQVECNETDVTGMKTM